jgi:hypothetical protein
MSTLTIGELAQACDLKLETLRYYERIWLMPPRSLSRVDIGNTQDRRKIASLRIDRNQGTPGPEAHEEDRCTDVAIG